MTLLFVGRGNANVCYLLSGEVYRISLRYQKLSRNNAYVQDNFQFIDSKIRSLPMLADVVVSMRLEEVFVDTKWINVLKDENILIDDSHMQCIVMPLLHAKDSTCEQLDHFNQIYRCSLNDAITWEFKPKWLYQSSDYCRNCTHNSLKGRDIEYCFLHDPELIIETLFAGRQVPEEFLDDILQYLQSSDSITQRLYAAQRFVKDDLSTLMTLRDVTCFLTWSRNTRSVKATIIDVDQKPANKLRHWQSTESALASFPGKKKAHFNHQ